MDSILGLLSSETERAAALRRAEPNTCPLLCVRLLAASGLQALALLRPPPRSIRRSSTTFPGSLHGYEQPCLMNLFLPHPPAA